MKINKKKSIISQPREATNNTYLHSVSSDILSNENNNSKINPRVVYKNKKKKARIPNKHPESTDNSFHELKNIRYGSNDTITSLIDDQNTIKNNTSNDFSNINFNTTNNSRTNDEQLKPRIIQIEEENEDHIQRKIIKTFDFEKKIESLDEESDKILNPRFYYLNRRKNLKSKDFQSESGEEDEENNESDEEFSLRNGEKAIRRNTNSIDFLKNKPDNVKTRDETLENSNRKLPVGSLSPLPVKIKAVDNKKKIKKNRREMLRRKRFERNLTLFNEAWNKLELKDAVYLKMLDFKPGKIVKSIRIRNKKKSDFANQELNSRKVKSFEIKRRKKNGSKSPQKGKIKPPFVTNFSQNKWYNPNLPNEIYNSLVQFDNEKLRDSIKKQNLSKTNELIHKNYRFGETFDSSKFHKFSSGRPLFLVRKSADFKHKEKIQKNRKISTANFRKKMPILVDKISIVKNRPNTTENTLLRKSSNTNKITQSKRTRVKIKLLI